MPIAERQGLLDILFEQMGGDVKQYTVHEDKEERCSDEEIIAQASAAVNGDKFTKLYTGDWQGMYQSQSEADFALTDIIAFYTQNKAQIARIFRGSALGQRDKAQRDDYIRYMVEKSFDRQLPQLDVEGMRQMLANMLARNGATDRRPGGSTAAAPTDARKLDRTPPALPVDEYRRPHDRRADPVCLPALRTARRR